jgi:hypothetical protein
MISEHDECDYDYSDQIEDQHNSPIVNSNCIKANVDKTNVTTANSDNDPLEKSNQS